MFQRRSDDVAACLSAGARAITAVLPEGTSLRSWLTLGSPC
jgi:hypothetical protein